MVLSTCLSAGEFFEPNSIFLMPKEEQISSALLLSAGTAEETVGARMAKQNAISANHMV